LENPTKPVPKVFKEIRRSIIASGIQGATNSEIVDAIPVFTSIKSSGYRKKMKMIPSLPSNLCNLLIEDDWRSTNDGRDFLLGNYFTFLILKFKYTYSITISIIYVISRYTAVLQQYVYYVYKLFRFRRK